jgi:glycosyltransferase involved in cell wall biosynthesis
MRATLAGLSFFLFFAAAATSAQESAQPGSATNSPDYTAVNCSGFVSDNVSTDIRVISGEQSNLKITFTRGDYVYINRGRDKGVQVGDRFSVVRPTSDPLDVQWFKWQQKLIKAMGQLYADTGQVRVVNVQPNVSIAQIDFSCGYMERGDIVRPYVERPSPPFKDAPAFDHFAPVNGKRVGMVVAGIDNTEMYGKNTTVYVNLGSNQSVRIGDYFRIFRYEGTLAETAPQTKNYQYELYGFGSAHAKYTWKDLPREIIGEGIVINEGSNGSTMLITYSSLPVYAGDYVELE